MENQSWAYFTTLFTQVDPYWECQHTDPGFYQVLARVCEQRQTHDLDMPSTNITSHFYTFFHTFLFSSSTFFLFRRLGVNFFAHAHPLHECSKYRKGVDQFDMY